MRCAAQGAFRFVGAAACRCIMNCSVRAAARRFQPHCLSQCVAGRQGCRALAGLAHVGALRLGLSSTFVRDVGSPPCSLLVLAMCLRTLTGLPRPSRRHRSSSLSAEPPQEGTLPHLCALGAHRLRDWREHCSELRVCQEVGALVGARLGKSSGGATVLRTLGRVHVLLRLLSS